MGITKRPHQYTGLTLEESYGRGWNTPFHPDDKQAAWDAWNHATRSGEKYRVESRLRGADGSYCWFLMLGEPLRNAQGSVVRWFGTCTDIEDLKRAEEELRRSEEARKVAEAVYAERLVLQTTLQRFYVVLSSMYSGILLVRDDGLVEFANQAFCDLFGLGDAPADLVGLGPGDIIGKIKDGYLRSDEAVARIQEILDGGQPVKGEELDMRGERKWLRNFVPLNVDGKSYGRLWLHLDITERERAEEALLRSEKLASVGRMAASIAHEINNPLEAIANTIYLALTNANEPESVRQFLTIAEEELRRIAHITRQTLGFYRESSTSATVCVNSIMDSAVDLLRGKIRVKDATIEKQYNGDLQVMAVPGELRQVFSNLLANSLDAMDQKGTIKLRVSNSTCVNSGQPRVRVTVADDGKGIDAATLPHIFEPLFTTKEATGSGLGLWVSKQLLEKHGGSIRVRTRTKGERRGTTFSVILAGNCRIGVTSRNG